MPAPVPTEITGGGQESLRDKANRIYSNYAWIARFTVEMADTDTQLDRKKLIQTVRVAGAQFILDTATITPLLRDAVLRRFEAEGLVWPNVATEFPALRQAIIDWGDWMSTNFPVAMTEIAVSEMYLPDGERFLTDRPILDPWPPALQTYIQTVVRPHFE